MAKRPYQIGQSLWAVERRPLGWFVVESWREIDRWGEKADEFELFGPFETREEAAAERGRLEAL